MTDPNSSFGAAGSRISSVPFAEPVQSASHSPNKLSRRGSTHHLEHGPLGAVGPSGGGGGGLLTPKKRLSESNNSLLSGLGAAGTTPQGSRQHHAHNQHQLAVSATAANKAKGYDQLRTLASRIQQQTSLINATLGNQSSDAPPPPPSSAASSLLARLKKKGGETQPSRTAPAVPASALKKTTLAAAQNHKRNIRYETGISDDNATSTGDELDDDSAVVTNDTDSLASDAYGYYGRAGGHSHEADRLRKQYYGRFQPGASSPHHHPSKSHSNMVDVGTQKRSLTTTEVQTSSQPPTPPVEPIPVVQHQPQQQQHHQTGPAVAMVSVDPFAPVYHHQSAPLAPPAPRGSHGRLMSPSRDTGMEQGPAPAVPSGGGIVQSEMPVVANNRQASPPQSQMLAAVPSASPLVPQQQQQQPVQAKQRLHQQHNAAAASPPRMGTMLEGDWGFEPGGGVSPGHLDFDASPAPRQQTNAELGAGGQELHSDEGQPAEDHPASPTAQVQVQELVEPEATESDEENAKVQDGHTESAKKLISVFESLSKHHKQAQLEAEEQQRKKQEAQDRARAEMIKQQQLAAAANGTAAVGYSAPKSPGVSSSSRNPTVAPNHAALRPDELEEALRKQFEFQQTILMADEFGLREHIQRLVAEDRERLKRKFVATLDKVKRKEHVTLSAIDMSKLHLEQLQQKRREAHERRAERLSSLEREQDDMLTHMKIKDGSERRMIALQETEIESREGIVSKAHQSRLLLASMEAESFQWSLRSQQQREQNSRELDDQKALLEKEKEDMREAMRQSISESVERSVQRMRKELIQDQQRALSQSPPRGLSYGGTTPGTSPTPNAPSPHHPPQQGGQGGNWPAPQQLLQQQQQQRGRPMQPQYQGQGGGPQQHQGQGGGPPLSRQNSSAISSRHGSPGQHPPPMQSMQGQQGQGQPMQRQQSNMIQQQPQPAPPQQQQQRPMQQPLDLQQVVQQALRQQEEKVQEEQQRRSNQNSPSRQEGQGNQQAPRFASHRNQNTVNNQQGQMNPNQPPQYQQQQQNQQPRFSNHQMHQQPPQQQQGGTPVEHGLNVSVVQHLDLQQVMQQARQQQEEKVQEEQQRRSNQNSPSRQDNQGNQQQQAAPPQQGGQQQSQAPVQNGQQQPPSMRSGSNQSGGPAAGAGARSNSGAQSRSGSGGMQQGGMPPLVGAQAGNTPPVLPLAEPNSPSRVSTNNRSSSGGGGAAPPPPTRGQQPEGATGQQQQEQATPGPNGGSASNRPPPLQPVQSTGHPTAGSRNTTPTTAPPPAALIPQGGQTNSRTGSGTGPALGARTQSPMHVQTPTSATNRPAGGSFNNRTGPPPPVPAASQQQQGMAPPPVQVQQKQLMQGAPSPSPMADHFVTLLTEGKGPRAAVAVVFGLGGAGPKKILQSPLVRFSKDRRMFILSLTQGGMSPAPGGAPPSPPAATAGGGGGTASGTASPRQQPDIALPFAALQNVVYPYGSMARIGTVRGMTVGKPGYQLMAKPGMLFSCRNGKANNPRHRYTLHLIFRAPPNAPPKAPPVHINLEFGSRQAFITFTLALNRCRPPASLPGSPALQQQQQGKVAAGSAAPPPPPPPQFPPIMSRGRLLWMLFVYAMRADPTPRISDKAFWNWRCRRNPDGSAWTGEVGQPAAGVLPPAAAAPATN